MRLVKRSTAGALGGLVLGVALFSACDQSQSSCAAPKLAPNQPNGSSALASAMVAMDSQLQVVLEAVMADPNHAWEGYTLASHDLLALEPTDVSMINGHFTTHAPLYSRPSPNSTKPLRQTTSTLSFPRAQIVTTEPVLVH